jgi:hypothetical protein
MGRLAFIFNRSQNAPNLEINLGVKTAALSFEKSICQIPANEGICGVLAGDYIEE